MFLRTDNPPLASSASSDFFFPLLPLKGQCPTCSVNLNGKTKNELESMELQNNGLVLLQITLLVHRKIALIMFGCGWLG